jgi:hypothetical protein
MAIGDERGSQALWNAKTNYIIWPGYASELTLKLRNHFNSTWHRIKKFGIDFQLITKNYGKLERYLIY